MVCVPRSLKEASIQSAEHFEAYDIGFLARCPEKLEFQGGVVRPVEGLRDLVEEVAGSVHEQDGFLYPPITQRWKVRTEFTEEGSSEAEPELVRGSRRQALLFRLPTTHTILLADRVNQREYGHGDEAFILHALAYMFGTRLQFSRWFVDMRIPIKKDTRDFFLKAGTAERFLSNAYEAWRGWAPGAQGRIVNALYMNSRSPSYEWDWERFAIDYMVFDALYKNTNELHGLECQTHYDRLPAMCRQYGVPEEPTWLKAIYDLRNELFHESLWDGHQPGVSTDEGAFRTALNLRYLNLRLIAGVLGYVGEYLQSEWWGLWNSVF